MFFFYSHGGGDNFVYVMLIMSKETHLNDTNGKKQSYFKANRYHTFRQL